MADKIPGYDDFFKNLLKQDSLYDRIKISLSKKDSTDLYEYMGERNSGIWSDKLRDILDTHKAISLSKQEKVNIEDAIGDLLSNRGGSGRCEYPRLQSVVNSRFGDCWFLKESIDTFGTKSAWDICVQKFSDDWFIVNIGSSQGHFNYWYRCDTINGVLKLIEDKFKN